jgi:CO/xanthine dehydrogenase FAD-binding subunit
MPIWKNYHLANSIEDALSVLRIAEEPSRIIAGGTDLLLDLQQGRHPPVNTLVDVTSVPEMNRLEILDQLGPDCILPEKVLFIGAAVALKKITGSSLVVTHAQALVEAANLIGGLQVRNTATLGGNVAHALPAADGAIALLALKAKAVVASRGGWVIKPLIDLYAGPGRSTLNPRQEILVGFILPLTLPGQASAFARIMRPQGVALPVLNMAVWIERKVDLITDCHLSLGPAGQVPQTSPRFAGCLCGKSMTADTAAMGLDILLDEVHFRTSPHRASAEYRQQLTGVLLNEVLEKAWDRAKLA